MNNDYDGKFPNLAIFYRKNSPQSCYIYHTYSDIPELGRVHYHFNDDGSQALTPDMVYLNTSKPCMGCIGYMVYGWHSGWLSPMRAREQFNVAVIGLYLAESGAFLDVGKAISIVLKKFCN